MSLGLWLSQASAQQATIGTPFRSLNDGFFEHMGSSWSLQGKGWNFSFGAPNNAAPQFGGFDPSAGLTGGVGFRTRSGLSGSFSGNWSQGFRQSLVSQTPMVTIPNGGTGYVADTSISPFVMGFVPVVGGFPTFGPMMPPMMAPSFGMPVSSIAPGGGTSAVQQALRRAQGNAGQQTDDQAAGPAPNAAAIPPAARPKAKPRAPQDDLVFGGPQAGAAAPTASESAGGRSIDVRASSAGRPAPSVEEARRMHAAERSGQSGELAGYLERARNAQASGKDNVARIYYRMALRRASGEVRQQIAAELRKLAAAPQE